MGVNPHGPPGAARVASDSVATTAPVPTPDPLCSRPADADLLRFPGRVVRVFEQDPDLLAGVDAATARLLRDRGVARAVDVDAGAWTPPAGDGGALGLLVMDGLVVRSVSVLGHDCPELLGEGDLLRPWDPPAPAPPGVGGTATWRVLTPMTVAVLDARFGRRIGMDPRVTAALLGRATARSRSLAFHLALCRLRHAEERLLVLLWHLAERWGRVTPDGVALALPLTHELLARLTGMRRPTASTAVQQLVRAGRLTREGRSRWTLHGDPPGAGELSAA